MVCTALGVNVYACGSNKLFSTTCGAEIYGLKRAAHNLSVQVFLLQEACYSFVGERARVRGRRTRDLVGPAAEID